MPILTVLAVVPVADMDASVAWYEHLFDRPPDARAMPSLADWHLTDTAWVQVFHDPDRAGSTLFNLTVADLSAQLAELAERGISSGEIATTSKAGKLAALTDPDGNTITLIENPDT